MPASTRYSPVSGAHAFPRHPQYNSGIAHSASRSEHDVPPKPLPPLPHAPDKDASPSRHSFFVVWWKELGTCLLTLAALFAIVATILPHDGKPLPNWPYSLSINTLLSIYVAVLKFTMAFVLAECIGQIKFTWFEQSRPLSDLVPYDDASRGSLWGSLKLLWMLRGRSILASIGAVVTVLAAAIDPFAQQLVSYSVCSQNSPGQNASIPIMRLWASSSPERTSNVDVALGYDMQGAILNGLLSRGLPFDPPFNCATGNCTFTEPYYTIGFCSVCEDVTDEISVSNISHFQTATSAIVRTAAGVTTTFAALQTLTDDDGTPYSTSTQIESVAQTGTVTTAAFATTTILRGYDVNFRLGSGQTVNGSTGDFGVSVNSSGSSGSGGLRSTGSALVPGFSLQVLYGGEADPHKPATYQNNTDTRWQERGFGAARCNIQPCVQGYKASVDNGKLRETLIETSYNQSWWGSSDIYEIVRTGCLKDPKQIAALERQANVAPGKLPAWFAYNTRARSEWTQLWNDTDVPENCTFAFQPAGAAQILQFFSTLFSNSAHVDARGTGAAIDLAHSALWINGNITFATVNGTIANITRSMSNTMRQPQAPLVGNQTTGVMTYDTTCVNVQWPWLTFPAILTVLTLLCFVLTSILTHVKAGDNLRAHDFKTALLPLIFAAARLQQPPHDAQCSGAQSEIEDSVKKRHVRFERTDDGWYFTEDPAATG